VLPLKEHREFCAAKYVLRCYSNENYSQKEVSLRSDINFVQRARSIASLTFLKMYTSDIFKDSKIDKNALAVTPSFSAVPEWEMNKPIFDVSYKSMKNRFTKRTCKLSEFAY